MEMKTTKQIMVHNVKRAPNYWGKIRFFCFTPGPDEGPTGAETPLVAMLKEALCVFMLTNLAFVSASDLTCRKHGVRGASVRRVLT